MADAVEAALRLGQVRVLDVNWGSAESSVEFFSELVLRGPLYKLEIGGEQTEVWHGDLGTLARVYVVRLLARTIDQ